MEDHSQLRQYGGLSLRWPRLTRRSNLYDNFTGLPNRLFFSDQLNKVLVSATPEKPGAILLLEIDNFKVVNDTLGVSAGDRVLLSLVDLLSKNLDEDAFLARWGSDEFAVLLQDTDPSQAESIAERLRRRVHDFHFTDEAMPIAVTTSIGMVLFQEASQPETILALADTALQSAKDQGKNRVVTIYARESDLERLAEESRLITRIRNSLAENRFLIHFQPIVDLRDGKIDHLEALIRLPGDDQLPMLPSKFLETAERCGLMSNIDRWVVRSVLTILNEHPLLSIFVNLSPKSLMDLSLLEFIESSVKKKGIQPGQLSFEITENTAIEDMELARTWMHRLMGLGCEFALDDFGTGFSSFSHLRSLPAQYVKIDGSFVSNLDTDARNRALVQALSTAVHAMGKQPIAEHVESASVVEILQSLGVTKGQGYHLGRPHANWRQWLSEIRQLR